MAALTDRQAARARWQAVFAQALDRIIPADTTRPLKGATFLEWERQADEFDRTVTAAWREDWGTGYDGKQVQRWAQALGRTLLGQQAAQVRAYEQGRRPPGPENDPRLLVIEMDGGRVQGRDPDPQTQSRWREDKVLALTSYRPGDGKQRDPQPLVTTYLATMQDRRGFGMLARVEAERRGLRQAQAVVVLGDGAAWIDTLHDQQFPRHVRIVDGYHAVEHLHAVAQAAYPQQPARGQRLVDNLEKLLWRGEVAGVIKVLTRLTAQAGPPQAPDPAEHPRRVLAQNLGYFQRHQEHMNYPAYRQRGWPIGSGRVEAGVKQFNKRVKGTEQFWHEAGVEPILALRALWLSQDDRWDHSWRCGRQIRIAA